MNIEKEEINKNTIKSNSYVSLHCHTNLGSIRDSVAKLEPLISKAKTIGMQSLGISDHGSMSATFKFYKECNKQGVKPIIGLEAYYTPHEDMKDKTYHLCIYAKNNIGLQNLYKISSSAYINYFYRKPRVTQELLFNNSEGLIVTGACMQGPFSRMFIDGDTDGAINSIKAFSEHFGDDFYLEVHNHGIEDETRAREFIRNVASDLKIKCIGSTDVHMVNKSDRQIHNIYKQLSYGSVGKSDDDAFEGDGYHLLDFEEYGELFTEDEANNTLEIADKCNISIKHSEYHLPKFDTNGVPSYEYIKDLAYKGLKRIGKENNKEYTDRLEYELGIIHMGGLEDYFLIVGDTIQWCRDNDVPYGPGRGCLTGDAAVLTKERGFSKLCDIKIGDHVFTHDGTIGVVENTFRYDVKGEDLLEINAQFAFDSIKLTNDHKVYGAKKKYTKQYLDTNAKGKDCSKLKKYDYDISSEWIQARDLSVDDFLFMPWPKQNVINFPNIDLGQYVGEIDNGYYISNNNVFQRKNVNEPLRKRVICKKFGFSRNGFANMLSGNKKLNCIGISNLDKFKEYLFEYNLTLDEYKDLHNNSNYVLQRFIEYDEDFCYLIGRWIGDGWIMTESDKYLFGIAFNANDTCGIKKIGRILSRYGFKYSLQYATNGKQLVQMYVYGKPLALLFRDLFPDYKNSSNTKYIGKFKYLKNNLLRALISGLKESDGNNSDSKECIDTTSSRMAYEIKECLLYLKIPSSVYTRNEFYRGRYLCKKSYKIKFLGLLKNRKIRPWYINESGYYCRIKSINVTSADYVYDISIPGNTSYVTQGFAVHNSSAGSLLCYCLGITELDPIPYNLMFSRMLNAGRLLQYKFLED